MLKYLLKIIPSFSNSDLNDMEKKLTSKLKRAAKAFGRGLSLASKSMGFLALIGGALNKFLNPLEELKTLLRDTFGKGSDLKVFAKEFNTTGGKLAKIKAFAETSGLDSSELFSMMEKFKTGLAKAEKSSEPTVLDKFKGRSDIADAFFEFIQDLQATDVKSRALIQEDVFGGRAAMQMAHFLDQDFSKLVKSFSSLDTKALDKAVDKTAKLGEMDRLLKTKGDLGNFLSVANRANAGMVQGMARSEDRKENAKIRQLNSFQAYMAIQEKMDQMADMFQTAVETVIKVIQDIPKKLNEMFDFFKKFSITNIMKAIRGGK